MSLHFHAIRLNFSYISKFLVSQLKLKTNIFKHSSNIFFTSINVRKNGLEAEPFKLEKIEKAYEKYLP